MGEWSIANIKNISRLLKCFNLASGLNVNYNKSWLFGVGASDFEMEMATNMLNCKKGSLPFNHLGIPVGQNMNKISSWEPIVDKFKRKLTVWKAKQLSFGGRLTLVKSVLGSLPIYYMSIFKIPSMVIKKLEGLRRKFLWRGETDKEGISWVK